MNRFVNRNGIFLYAVLSFIILLLPACATYYQKNEKFMNAVYSNDFEAAKKLLKDDAAWEKHKRNKLLFYLNKGTLLWMQGEHATSNTYFQKADFFVDEYNKSAGDFALTLLVNSNLTTYGGENFEQILLHYYGALNYLSLGQTEEALIEGKRMLEKMQKISDKYENKNKYKRDAFAHNLLGLIYDMRGEYNDAYIAYKNAYDIYTDDYLKQFGTKIPLQLKKDLLRTAKAIGFYEEVRKFEADFNLKAETLDKEKGQVLFFWNNGLGPIKDQFSISVMIIPYGNGWVEFVNPELGIAIPFRTNDSEQSKDLLGMKYIKLALPKYVSREPYYSSAQLVSNGTRYDFNLGEDINAIAYKSLEDRMGKELTMGLSRVALKQLAVYKAQQIKDQNGLAAAAMLYSAFSEKADTRNWQLLPYSINYSRIALDTGAQSINFEAYTKQNNKGASKKFDVTIRKGTTKVLSTQTIEFSGLEPK